MKKTILFLSMWLVAGPVAANAEWSTKSFRDGIENDLVVQASSALKSPTRRLSFPYDDLKARVRYQCGTGDVDEILYWKFTTTANLVGDTTHDGYNSISLRLKFDQEESRSVRFLQNWGGDFVYITSTQKGDILEKIVSYNQVRIEVPWYGQGNVIFQHSLSGAKQAINSARQKCGLSPIGAISPLTPPDISSKAFIENPSAGSFQSGIGVISGWACEADSVRVRLTNGNTKESFTWDAAYGTTRVDTEGVCEDTNNGFALLFNWNILGDGEHTVRVLGCVIS